MNQTIGVNEHVHMVMIEINKFLNSQWYDIVSHVDAGNVLVAVAFCYVNIILMLEMFE